MNAAIVAQLKLLIALGCPGFDNLSNTHQVIVDNSATNIWTADDLVYRPMGREKLKSEKIAELREEAEKLEKELNRDEKCGKETDKLVKLLWGKK